MSPQSRYRNQFTGLAHRGGGLEDFENSFSAFANAIRLGYTVIETDIQISRDQTIYIFHDDTLDRTTTGQGIFSEKSDAELAKITLKNGEPIPTLEAILAKHPDIILNIDVKTDHGIAPMANFLNTHQCHDRICLASFSTKRLNAIRQRLDRPLDHLCAFSGGQADILRLFLGQFGLPMGKPDICAAQVPVSHFGIPLVTKRFIKHCHKLGIAVHVWTIDEDDEMRRLIALGVNGLVTDRPSTLKDIAGELGLPL